MKLPLAHLCVIAVSLLAARRWAANDGGLGQMVLRGRRGDRHLDASLLARLLHAGFGYVTHGERCVPVLPMRRAVLELSASSLARPRKLKARRKDVSRMLRCEPQRGALQVLFAAAGDIMSAACPSGLGPAPLGLPPRHRRELTWGCPESELYKLTNAKVFGMTPHHLSTIL